MKNIFDAIRALKPQMRLPHAQLALQSALWRFERANRGHSHEIDTLAHAMAGKRRQYLETPGFVARSRTLNETTRHLMDVLPPLRREWPSSPEFEALWATRDETGLIARVTQENLTRLWAGSMSFNGPWFKNGYQLRRLGVGSLRDGHLEITAVVGLRDQSLQATRTLRIQTEGFDSLEGSWKLRRDLDWELTRLLESLSASPEFAPSRIEQARRERLRNRLEQALKEFGDADLAWAFEHWTELRPAALRRAATQARMR
jgi:hypothetical protein